MVTTTRSTAFAVGAISPTGSNLAYTVPAGMVLLVKSVYLTATQNGTNSVSIYAERPAGVYSFLLQASMDGSEPVAWTGWVVLEEGDQLHIGTGLFPLNYWASGALLKD